MGAGDGYSPLERFASSVVRVIDGPITWFRGKNFYFSLFEQ